MTPNLGIFKKNQISLFGGFNFVQKYGTADDYIPGENNFPITPSHTSYHFGLSFFHSLIRHFGLEVDLRYNLHSEITLEDPVEGEKITLDTNKNFNLSLNGYYEFLPEKKISPYLVLGGGVNRVQGSEVKIYISDWGNEVEVLPSEEKTVLIFTGGGGVIFTLYKAFGVRFDGRFILINDKPKITTYNLSLGFVFRL